MAKHSGRFVGEAVPPLMSMYGKFNTSRIQLELISLSDHTMELHLTGHRTLLLG